jgi:mannosyltransferase OCH1-like enzyme
MARVLAYWDRDDRSMISQFVADWSAAFPHLRVAGDEDVVPLIERHASGFVDLYKAIRFPAAKGDVARLLLLYEFGGLYVDCGMGLADLATVKRLLATLEREAEVILVDRGQQWGARPAEAHRLINGIIFSRPRNDLVLAVLRQALANLAAYKESEACGSTPISIWRLVGAGVLNRAILTPGNNREIQAEYRRRVRIVREEDVGIVRARYQTYSDPSQHWSNREKVEPLFLTQHA